MIPTLVLALALFADPAPADGVRLAPDPAPAPPTTAAPAPTPGAPAGGVIPVTAGSAAAGLALLAAARRSAGRRKGEVGEPLVVFVSGHGNSSAPGLFARLAARLGLDAADARYFDYRWAEGGRDFRRASEDASMDETVAALDGYLAGLGETGRPIYLIGFSKGGAGIAELVARWDRGVPGATHGVVGAALLDPPLASGIHGWLQSVGSAWGFVPDDGGYDPMRCSLLNCTDTRDHLGEASGVEVVVMRNPQAGITNFADVPEGLRVYEASDGGPGFFRTLFTRPWDLVSRATRAHMAVLDDVRVADCISAEITGSGSCSLPRMNRITPGPASVPGGGSPLRLPPGWSS